jgi:hypothetical protein
MRKKIGQIDEGIVQTLQHSGFAPGQALMKIVEGMSC